MPYLTTNDQVKLYYEDSGAGRPILFIHEFSGDYRAWELQVRYFARRYRCITYNARGYPPSEVPDTVDKYSQRRAVDDAVGVLDHLEIEKAHIVGLSMGGFAALNFGIHYPERAVSLVVGAAGMGAEPDKAAQFRQEVEVVARRWETEGAAKFAPIYGSGPGREQLEMKDPRGFKEFIDQLSEHSATGAALTLRGVQARRPSPFELVAAARKDGRADVDHSRRRRPLVPRHRRVSQTHHSLGRPDGVSEDRPHHQSRRAGAVQFRCAGLHYASRQRPLDAPRQAN